jgi:hypothetical protein
MQQRYAGDVRKEQNMLTCFSFLCYCHMRDCWEAEHLRRRRHVTSLICGKDSVIPTKTRDVQETSWLEGFPFGLPELKTKKVKLITVTGRGGLQSCEMLKFPHCVDSRLTDGTEVVSLTCLPRFNPRKICWYSFLLEAESTPGP